MRVTIDWSVAQYCIDCGSEMRKPKSEHDPRPVHYANGRCSKCYYLHRSSDSTRRYDWSKPRYCAACKKQMRSNHSKSDGVTVKHASAGICINCKDIATRAKAGSKTRTKLHWDEYGQTCKYCHRHLPFDKFPSATHNPTGKRSKCTWCQNIWDAYRLTFEQYSTLLTEQNGVCAGCREEPLNGSFVVDHDHACCAGERTCGHCIRGLLCVGCNLALGHVKDSSARLTGLIEYLNNYK